MLRKVIYHIACFLLPVIVCGQELKPTVTYMNMHDVSQIAKDVHSGRIVPSDNTLIYTIADSMSTDNDNTRAFYIFLVSKMLLNSTDETLKNALAAYCLRIIQNKPDPVMALLYSKGVKPDYKYEWAKAIAKQISLDCHTTLLECFKTSRLLSLERSSERNKDKVEAIFNSIRSNLNLQRH